MLNSTPLQTINALAKTYAAKRAKLDEITTAIDDEQRQVLRAHKTTLRAAFNAVAAAQSDLHAEITAHPELFEKPRTFVIDGIKVGYQKQKGKIIAADVPKTIALIRKHLGEDAAATLIKTEETVVMTAAANLPASDLKRIGIDVIAGVDKVMIVPVDSALDKLLERLIEEAGKEEA